LGIGGRVPRRVDAANVAGSKFGNIDHAINIQTQTYRLEQYCLSARTIDDVAFSAACERAHESVYQIYFSNPSVVRIGDKKEVAVKREHQAGRSIETRVSGYSVRKSGNTVARYRINDDLPTLLRNPADRMIAGIGNINCSVGGYHHFVRQSEGGVELACVTVACHALAGAVEDLLLDFISHLSEQSRECVNRYAARGPLHTAHNAVAVF